MEVVIDRILPGGLGLAHADGRTIMVALAAPGDRLRVRVDRVKGSVAFASIVEVIEPSPVRVEPPCPYVGRCGGCDFQQMSYPAQLNAKVQIIRDCLRRIAGIEEVPPFEITPAPHEWRYRARAQWQYDGVRRRLGYFEANSHRVCDVAECAVLAPELQRELENLRERMKLSNLPGDARYFRAIAGDDGVSIAAIGGERRRDTKPVVITGAREITRTIRGESYQLDAESFFQTNVDLLPALIDAALADAQGETAIELYSGVGLFTVPLARRFKNVTAIEDNAAASEFARRNLMQAGLSNVRVVKADVAGWVEKDLGRAGFEGAEPTVFERSSGGSKAPSPLRSAGALQNGALQNGALPDFLLLDPPRTGAEARVIKGIIDLRPKRICYVSCDPATLARDLKKLIAGGYSISSIRAFDMFPQTHHVETVVHLTG